MIRICVILVGSKKSTPTRGHIVNFLEVLVLISTNIITGFYSSLQLLS